jgi:hypothetical protein
MTIIQNVWQRLRRGRKRVIGELIGRTSRTYNWARKWWAFAPTRDLSTRDYKFWDEAAQCKTRGLELAGLFLKPLASKVAAWVQGSAPRWGADKPRGAELLNEWWGDHMSDIVQTYREAAKLADCYIVVNADLTATVIPPDVVTPIVNDDDYSEIIGWRIREVHPHPDFPGQKMTIEDEYYADRRVRTVSKNSLPISRTKYRNLIGRIPVIHVPNNPGANAVFGEPEGVALLPALMHYGALLENAINGNKHQALPTPVAEFESAKDLEDWWDMAVEIGLIQKTTKTHDDGETETYYEVNLEAGNFAAFAGAKFDYKNPGSFAGDTRVLLELLFYLVLQHTEIPEFAWGNAIASSKASAETQLLPFLKWIELKRMDCVGWMTDLARVVLGYYSIFERGVSADDKLTIGWEPLTNEDGSLTLNAIKWMLTEGLIDELTAVKLAPVDIQDAEGTLKKAREEAEERRAEREGDPASMDYARFLKREEGAQDSAGDDPAELEQAA